MSFNIFISYSTEDLEKIKPVVELLSNIQDARVFFAERTINPGAEITRTLTDNIKASDVFLVFYSKSARVSSYVQQEIGVAKAFNKIMIPILLDDTKPSGMLEGINYLNFHDPDKQQNEMFRLYQFIITHVQKKKQQQAVSTLALLGLGYLLLKGEEEDEY